MSRAFVKERDDAPEERFAVARSHPNYMTKEGLAALEKQLEREANPHERQRLTRSIESAVILSPRKHSPSVEFGSAVQVEGAGRGAQSFTIVGLDEADVEQGKIAFTSPLAQALLHARIGDVVVWKRPKGDRRLTVTSIS